MEIKDLRFDKKGLIPAIIQDEKTKAVLMLAYMNKRSLARTLKLGRTCFWSRSRKEYWIKGATSGNVQLVKSIYYDCDMDALLIKVRQKGVACHTGNRSCFYRKLPLEVTKVKNVKDVTKVTKILKSNLRNLR
jgi:phosphoribosyl-ATP pyrophosphohydrolase/phosphoribosyl-AMP cyclohydrolase